MKPAKPLKEVFIISNILIVVWLLVFYITGSFSGYDKEDIDLHDTYFVMIFSWTTTILLPFLFWVMLVYIIRCVTNRFKNRLQNVILLAGTFCLSIQMLECFKDSAKLMANTSNKGWTIYPPLSQLSTHIPTPAPSPFSGIVNLLFVIQIILLLILVIIAILTGKNWKTIN